MGTEFVKENDVSISSIGLNDNTEKDSKYYPGTTVEDHEEADYWSEINEIPLINIKTIEKNSYDAKIIDVLEKLFNKYNQCTQHQKLISNQESNRIFGIDNISHYNYIKNWIINSDTESIGNKKVMPYFSPDELKELGVYSEIPKENFYNVTSSNESYEWFSMYEQSGFVGSDWYGKVSSVYSDYIRESSDINKQRLLELGWNPSIPLSNNTIYDISENTYSKLKNRYSVDIVDISNISVTESTKTKKIEIVDKVEDEPIYSNFKKLHPVYLVTIYSNTPFAKAVRLTTRDTYNHVAIGLNSSLNELYSYGIGTIKNVSGGLKVESIQEYLRYNKNTDMKVHILFLKDKNYNKLKKNLKYFIDNKEKTSYNYKNLFNILVNKSDMLQDQFSMICSQFVDSILRMVNINIIDKPSGLVRPEDIARVDNPKIYKIFEGKARDYNYKNIDKQLLTVSYRFLPILENANLTIDKILSFTEAKEFPIGFEDDGSLIIRNYKTLDLEMEYVKSNKLLKSYSYNSNIEPMKYELCKLWFFNTILLKKIEVADKRKKYDDKEKFIKLRAKVMNAFTIYLNEVNKYDKNFNFSAYYEDTPFSDTVLRISGSTLKYSKEYLMRLLL